MVKLISTGPLLLTRFEPRESLHPELKHQSLTTIIQDMAYKNGSVKRYDKPLSDDRLNAYSDMGQLWENALETEFKARQGKRAKKAESRLILQDKMCESGIHMIPDGYIKKKLGHEYKLTFSALPSSPDKVFDKHWSWKIQTQCYGHILGIYEWHFFVCWCHRWPEPVQYQLKYDKSECKDSWEMVLNNAKLMRQRSSSEI